MTQTPRLQRLRPVPIAIAGLIIALATGYGLGRWTEPSKDPMSAEGKDQPLYWYDPMVPLQHFDKPGKSPFMDMQLVPKFAKPGDAGAAAPAVQIDPATTQTLGMRVVAARRGQLASDLSVPGTIDFNQRDVAVVEARSAGFVTRVYGRAPGDVVGDGAPLADLLIPEWGGAQAEFLAVRGAGDAALTRAARQRLVLLGMPPATIDAIERTGKPHNVATIVTPIGGAITMLEVRAGMTLAAGQKLAQVNGLGTVWLDAAVPEAVAGRLRPGQGVTVSPAAFPGETIAGRIAQILPETRSDSHTLTARIALPNRGGRLRPGMFAKVAFASTARTALIVPSEAVIRTGKRTLVMLALDKGRYAPAEVRIGAETGGETEILAGLGDGERVVASGQFLIDSEASLSGITARPIAAQMHPDPAGPGQ